MVYYANESMAASDYNLMRWYHRVRLRGFNRVGE